METLRPGGVFLPHFDVFRVILCLHKGRCWHGKHRPGNSDCGSDMQHRDNPAHRVDCNGDQASWVRLLSTRPGPGCHSAKRSRKEMTTGVQRTRALSARFNSSTFTRGSPKTANWRPSMLRATNSFTLLSSRPRARATRFTWYIAAAGLM